MKRRAFIKSLAVISAGGLGAAAILSSCGKREKEQIPEGALNCGENLSPEAEQTRDQYDYLEYSQRDDEFCSNCTHWRAPEEGQNCGSCEVVKGPINPSGWCSQWLISAKPLS